MKITLNLSDKTAKQGYIHHKELLKDSEITPSLREICLAYCDEYEKNLELEAPELVGEFPELEKDRD